MIMILGYSIIAVPTGIISAEMIKASSKNQRIIKCRNCHKSTHDEDAKFCKGCGGKLDN